jgi:hypothetical protein
VKSSLPSASGANQRSARPVRAPATPVAEPRASGQGLTPWLVVVLVVVLFSGGLFGYDQGVISGALHGIKATFSLSPLVVEVVTSWVTLGALFGALASGELTEIFPRHIRGRPSPSPRAVNWARPSWSASSS